MALPRSGVAGLAVVGLGASIAPLDFAVNIAFPAMTAAFELDTRAIRWVAVCYVLVYGSLMLAFGALGDRIGHLRVFRAGLLLASISFIACALAPDYGWLLAARAVQGVAVALTLSCAPALATRLFAEDKRTWALSVFAAIGALAGVIAPLAGGAAIAVLGWPGVYWMRVPIALGAWLMLPVVARRLPKLIAAPSGAFDATAMVLLAASMAMLLLAPALLEAGTSSSPSVLLALAGGGLMLGFVLRQRRSAVPFLPHALLRDAGFVWPNLVAVMVQLTSFSVPLMLPYFYTRVLGWNTLATGALLACWGAGTLAGSAWAPRLASAVGVRLAALCGGLLAAFGLVTIALWPQAPSVFLMVTCLLVQGAGLGLYQVAYTDLVVAALPLHQRGVAGSLTMVTRTVGIVLGASLVTWAFARGESAAQASAQAIAATATQSATTATITVASGAEAAAATAFMTGFHTVFAGAAAALLLCFALTALRRGVWFNGNWRARHDSNV